jgi:hypothetical protein
VLAWQERIYLIARRLNCQLNHLPFFGLVKWNIKLLMPFATIAEKISQYFSHNRQHMTQSGQ